MKIPWPNVLVADSLQSTVPIILLLAEMRVVRKKLVLRVATCTKGRVDEHRMANMARGNTRIGSKGGPFDHARYVCHWKWVLTAPL